jgi:hypothetical protein
MVKSLFFSKVGFACILMFFVFACTKKETIELHEHAVVVGNVIPPNTTVSQIVLDNFINKSYIDLIGREPSSSELALHGATMKTNNYNENSRITMINTLLQSYAYYERFFNVFSAKMLENVDSITIHYDLVYFPIGIAEATANGFYSYAYYLQIQQANALNLQKAKNDYRNNTIDINTFFFRLINNEYYDDINMGTANYMLATFQNLFRRFPTADELERGIDMQNNEASILMGVDGSTKEDLATILTECDAFYEGLVYDAFDRLLVRVPTSQEMGDHTSMVKNQSYQALQRKLMVSKEYAGF